MALIIEDGKFKLPISISSAGNVTKELQTEGTYVDKNIEISINTPDGSLEAKETGVLTTKASIDSNIYTTDTETNYPITIKADASITDVKVGVQTSGFVDSTDEVVINGGSANTDSKTVYIKAGSLTGSGSASAEGGNGLTLGAKTNDIPESGFYVKASAAGGASVATAGWVDASTPSVSVDGDSYYAINSASLANSASAEKTYTEQSGPVLVSGDYLYINEGYIKDTKISLADLVPNEANVSAGVDGNSNLIYKTVSVYDKDGNLIAGTMGDASLSDIQVSNLSGVLVPTSIKPNEDNSAFIARGNVVLSGDTSVSIGETGYATTDMSKTGSVSGSVGVNTNLNKIHIGADTDNSNIVVKPVITKDNSSALATGDITTTAPSGHYVAISADAISAKTEISPKVIKEGYGSTTVFDATNIEVIGGSEASGLYYVPINEATHTLTKENPSIISASAQVNSNIATSVADGSVNILTVKPDSGDYLTITADAITTDGSVSENVKCESTEGYITSGVKTISVSETVNVQSTAAQTKYIKIYGGEMIESTI